MNTFVKINCLLLAFICFSSCWQLFGHDDVSIADQYDMILCFQDASGSNVSEGIDAFVNITNEGTVNPDIYSLDIILQDYDTGESLSGSHGYPAVYTSSLKTIEYKKLGTCIRISFSQDSENNKVRRFTYQLKCPYIFGDKEMHELVTYWTLKDNHYAECNRIEFEGQEIVPEYIKDRFFSLGIIKLDYVRE